MRLFVALLLVLIPLSAQQANFSKTLNAAIKALKMKQAPDIDLPDASFCDKTNAAYRCEWKTRANKASVVAQQDSIVAKVAAALPGWMRDNFTRDGRKVVRFAEPAGRISVSISAKSTEDGSPPWDYTVYLVVDDSRG